MKRIISLFLSLTFGVNCVVPQLALAQLFELPKPGAMVALSQAFTPACLKGMVIHPNDPFKFDFIINRGDTQLNLSQKKEEYTKLIKYFLAALAVPDEQQWVNLSPYEKNRIIPDTFGLTVMGRDLLGEDYMLKQITASMIYPEGAIGKRFWKRIYEEADKRYGTTNIPVNTFNKVWIIPDKATVYEKGNTVYILEDHLKVMLEQDYLSLQKHNSGLPLTTRNDIASVGANIVREIVLPALEKEVNEGKNFAPLRQVYSGMLLATWYKRTLKASLLGKLYANQGKVKGIDQDPRNNQQIYDQYLKAFKKGVFNMIKEDADQLTRQTIPRKYFSGGAYGFGRTTIKNNSAMSHSAMAQGRQKNDLAEVLVQQPLDAAMKAHEVFNRRTAIGMSLAAGVGYGIQRGLSWYQQQSDKDEEEIITKPFAEMIFSKPYGSGEIKQRTCVFSVEPAYFSGKKEDIPGFLMKYGKDIPDSTYMIDEINRRGIENAVTEVPIFVEGDYLFKIQFSVSSGHPQSPSESPASPASSRPRNAAMTASIRAFVFVLASLLLQQSGFGKSIKPKNEITWGISHLGHENVYIFRVKGNVVDYEKIKKFINKQGSLSAQDKKALKAALKEDQGVKSYQYIDKVITRITLPRGDRAMGGVQQKEDNITKYGGIDMNSANLAMLIKRDGKGMLLPVSQQNLDNIHLNGLVPHIISIRSAEDLPIFAQ